MSFALLMLSGEHEGETFPFVEGRTITVGRDAINDIRIIDRKLSRIHCQVDVVEGRCRLVDLNSTNGTGVNGQLISDETWVQLGDVIEIGITRMRLISLDEPQLSRKGMEEKQAPVEEGSLAIRCEECGREISDGEIASGEVRRSGDRYYCSACGVSFESSIDTESTPQPPARPPMAAFEPGREFAGVKVISMIGEGRLGPLYKGEQVSMGRLVVLKILNVTDEDWTKKYLQAVYSSGRLVHPNIVLIFDTGNSDGKPYVVREYVEGASIESRLASGEAMPVAEAFSVVTQAAYALESAFEQHIFHGGLSPRRILLDQHGTVKVSGFGLPRSSPPGCPTDAYVLNMLPYMPPERVKGNGAVDFAGDVYSLVAILYHMLSGRPPFRGSTREKLEHRILSRQPRPLGELQRDLPPATEKITERGLSKDPRARYQLPRELLYDLEENLRREI